MDAPARSAAVRSRLSLVAQRAAQTQDEFQIGGIVNRKTELDAQGESCGGRVRNGWAYPS